MSEPSGSSPAAGGRWRQLGRKVTLMCGTLVVLALLLEIGARLFLDVVPPLTVRDPVLGNTYHRSLRIKVYEPEAQREVFLRFNDVGFRGPDRPLEKPDGVRRVAIVGDSMIASLGVDEQDTLVHRLEQMLNESDSGETWEVMNFGVSGASPGQGIVLYRELVSRFEPDVVICGYFVGNDLADNCNRLSHNPRIYFDFDENGNYRQLPYSAAQARLSQFLNRHARFYVWQKHLLLKARDAAHETLHTFRPGAWIYCTKVPEKVEHAWRLTEAAIELFQREVVDRGGRFVFLQIPASEQIYRDRFETLAAIDEQYTAQFDWDHPDRRLGEICDRLGVPSLSLTEAFRAAAPGASSTIEAEWLFHRGMGHLNERGNEVAARAIHRFLTRGDG